MDFLSILVTAVVAGGGAYFGSYLKKKGENLATHEDVDKLVAQVAAVTETTKQIEAKISNDVWDRQRKWEAKRDALFEVVKDIGSMQSCLTSFIGIYRTESKAAKDHSGWEQEKKAAIDLYEKYDASLSRTMTLVMFVCGDEVTQKLGGMRQLMLEMFRLVVTGKHDEASDMWSKYADKFGDLHTAIRNELSMAK
jgi:outer membrane murein-binding lipoprotein Lpp